MRKPYILYVEDDEIEVVKFLHSIEPYFDTDAIEIKENGQLGWNFLDKNRAYPPKLIILDINMPEMNGLELLEKIKSDHDLNNIPVLMLTTSENQEDISISYQNQVAGYFIKPFDPDHYQKIIDIINTYWATAKTIG